MTVDEFIAHRRAELVEFFKGLYGKRYRAHTRNLHNPNYGTSSEFLRRIESDAMTKGFRPTNPHNLPLERRRFRELENLIAKLNCVIVTHHLSENLTFLYLVKTWLQHKPGRCPAGSDVIPPEKVHFRPGELRIPNPRAGRFVPKRFRVLDLLQHPASFCPTPTGGTPAPHSPLSGPSAHEKGPREESWLGEGI